MRTSQLAWVSRPVRPWQVSRAPSAEQAGQLPAPPSSDVGAVLAPEGVVAGLAR